MLSLLNEMKNESPVRLLLDSGAFTVKNAKANRKWLTLDNYMAFIKKHSDIVDNYVMLDVIGDDVRSKLNYERMIDSGLNPMFVMTMADNDFRYLKNVVENNNSYVCVAGGVTTKGDWMRQRFQRVAKTGAKIHGLGYVKYPDMYQLPIHSVDSSTWAQWASAYGRVGYFDSGIKNILRYDTIENKKPIPRALIRLMERVKLRPADFMNDDNFKGVQSVAVLINAMACIDYMAYSEKAGVKLYLVATNKNHLMALKYAYITDYPTYDGYKKYMGWL